MSSQDTPPPPVNWKLYVLNLALWFVLASGNLAIWYYAGKQGPPPPVPPPPAFEAYEPHNSFGWIDHPAEVKSVAERQRFATFGDTPAGAVAEDTLPDHVFLWEMWVKITGDLPPPKDQGKIGSCVSFGTNNAVRRTMMVQVFQRRTEEFKDIVEEVTYGGSRVQVGKGQIRGDGSVGAWAAQFVKDWGVVPRGKVGAYDFTAYSVDTCRTFGQKGVPADLQAIAKEHPVKAITKVTNWADCKKALAQGYGVSVCSNQGFSMTRDAKGVARAQGQWAHCMCIDGYVIDGGKEYGHVENSWGAVFKGPAGPGNPSAAGFWAESAVLNKMLGQGDSWAFSSFTGFPAQDLDWFVRAGRSARPVAVLSPRRVRQCFAMEPFYSLAP